MASQASAGDPVGNEIASAAVGLLARKAEDRWPLMFVLAILAGAFIALGSIGALVAKANMANGGGVELLAGATFSVGLLLVMVVGAQLFTGNTMMILSVVTGHLGVGQMAAAWAVVWLGNLMGGVAVALLFAGSGGLGDGVGDAAIALVDGKLTKSPAEILCSGILANLLVCLAVWMSMTARTLPAKVLVIIGPVTIFVAAGFEHCIANMALIPLGWLAAPAEAPDLMSGAINLIVSTVGNIIGGSILAVAIAYGHGSIRREPPAVE